MRSFCSWGRRAAHSHPLLALLIVSACALGVSLGGCSRGTNGRSLLSRLTRQDSTETLVGTSSVADESGTAPVGGLSEGARRVTSGAGPAGGQVSTEAQNEPVRTSPPTNDPWVRQQAPAIPDDGRPVASLDPSTNGNGHRSRGVDEWLAEIEGSRPSRPGDTAGTARLDELESETTARGHNPFAGTASLASSQQTQSTHSNERPDWAADTGSSSQVHRPAANPGHSQASDAVTSQTPSHQRQTQTADSSRRIDALLQVDALLVRAHDLEAQGQPHEAYRFALVAHQIVQQERLVLPPGQERPIDYLDALSAAADTVEADTSWDHRDDSEFERTPFDQHSSPVASSHGQQSSQPRNDWRQSFASETTSGDSPFQQATGFAEWRTMPADHATNSPEVHSATFGGGSTPVIRPSTMSTRQSPPVQTEEALPVEPQQGEQPPSYGPRFSDPVSSTNTNPHRDASVQPVSLSFELNDPIDVAGNVSPQTTLPPAWPGAGSHTASLSAADPSQQFGPASTLEFNQQLASIQGPGFGGQVDAASATDDVDAIEDEFDDLALTADAEPSGGIAGKPWAFWAMIGGLVLLLGCALLKRPADSKDSFH